VMGLLMALSVVQLVLLMLLVTVLLLVALKR
jgi:hypothetical protein